MSITISSTPLPYSSRSFFDVTSSLVEDASHINMRIEAQLISGATILAKKTNPVALTTFDFTDILRTYNKFTTPTPFTNPANVTLIAPTKTGSNLITSWANKTSFLYTNFTSSGANISVCNGTPVATNMMAETNSISFTAGTLYCLLWKSKTITGTPYIEIGSNGSCPLGTYSNYLSTEATGSVTRMYFLCKSTGSYKLTLGAKAGGGAVSFVGNYELYAMSAQDWFKPYSVKFIEKYEDSSGVTQTGATGDDFKMYLFFNSSENESDFQNYIDLSINGVVPFLNTDSYFKGYQRSYLVIKTPTTGNYSTARLMGMIPDSIYKIYDTLSLLPPTDIYSPIFCVNYASSNFADDTQITLLDYNGDTETHEYVYIVIDSKKYQYHKELSWLNRLGGISTFFFGDEYKQIRKNQRETYKDENKIERNFKTTPIYQITVGTQFLIRDETAEYLSDIIDSPLVMENTTILKEVFVQDEDMPIHDKNALMTAEITYQYGS